MYPVYPISLQLVLYYVSLVNCLGSRLSTTQSSGKQYCSLFRVDRLRNKGPETGEFLLDSDPKIKIYHLRPVWNELFWPGSEPVLWNRNYFLRFRFRFWLLKSYGSGSGSGSNFWNSYDSCSGSGCYLWKVTVPVPVPVPAPYLDHEKQIFQNKFWNFFAFLLSKLFYKEKVL